MIELADAPSYPETVMVEFSDAAIALPAVTTAEWLVYLACLAEASLR